MYFLLLFPGVSSLMSVLFPFFCSFIEKKKRIPVIGGKELDLHILYVEVTRRGGYEKVWPFIYCFISSLFNFRYIYLLIMLLNGVFEKCISLGC